MSFQDSTLYEYVKNDVPDPVCALDPEEVEVDPEEEVQCDPERRQSAPPRSLPMFASWSDFTVEDSPMSPSTLVSRMTTDPELGLKVKDDVLDCPLLSASQLMVLLPPLPHGEDDQEEQLKPPDPNR